MLSCLSACLYTNTYQEGIPCVCKCILGVGFTPPFLQQQLDALDSYFLFSKCLLYVSTEHRYSKYLVYLMDLSE